jgi:hypothetical protein
MPENRPRVNQSGFAVVQQRKVLALVPDERLEEVSAALAEEGADIARVEVLQGETGACILDLDGTEHGRWAHLVRAVQKLGTASNERENYAAALRGGESVVIVPVRSRGEVDSFARVLVEHGGRRVIHFGRFTTDQLSY